MEDVSDQLGKDKLGFIGVIKVRNVNLQTGLLEFFCFPNLQKPLIWLPFVDLFLMHCGHGAMEAMLGQFAEHKAGAFAYIQALKMQKSLFPIGGNDSRGSGGGLPGLPGSHLGVHLFREFLFMIKRKKKVYVRPIFLAFSLQLMDRARHPLLLVVYPVLGDLFMMLGMALVWPKLFFIVFSVSRPTL